LRAMVPGKRFAAGIVLVMVGTAAASGGSASERKAAAGQKAAKARVAATASRYAEPISLDLKDADLKDVLRTFAELEKINIAIDPEVRGSVTVRLENVPWDQALEVILATNGLGYILEGNVLRVGTPEKLLPRNRDQVP
jgi:type IV pilus assembly protein PilQ